MSPSMKCSCARRSKRHKPPAFPSISETGRNGAGVTPFLLGSMPGKCQGKAIATPEFRYVMCNFGRGVLFFFPGIPGAPRDREGKRDWGQIRRMYDEDERQFATVE